jgi:hypothetical protein
VNVPTPIPNPTFNKTRVNTETKALTDTELLVKLLVEVENIKSRMTTFELQLADVKEHHVDARGEMAKRPRTQIKDNTTGRVFKSKNATYQTLLREGALKELVEVGLFGDDSKGNNFGWFALNRALPGRFEEVTPEPKSTDIPKA